MSEQNQNIISNIAQKIAPETRYKTKYKDIQGIEKEAEFQIMHLPPSVIYKKLPKIGRLIGVPAGMIMAAANEGFAEALPAAMLQLFNTFDEENLELFIKELLDSVYLQGTKVTADFDGIFMNAPHLPLQLAVKVLEVAYTPFFSLDFKEMLPTLAKISQVQQMNSAQL
jgi:hypothetical protein